MRCVRVNKKKKIEATVKGRSDGNLPFCDIALRGLQQYLPPFSSGFDEQFKDVLDFEDSQSLLSDIFCKSHSS